MPICFGRIFFVSALLAVLSIGASYFYAGTISPSNAGHMTCYDTYGNMIPCAGTGHSGNKQAGAVLKPRFTDNNNGTVTDNLTGLIWLKDANCTGTVGGVNKASGRLTWQKALVWSNHLESGRCGLSDGSKPGDWRLPDIHELISLVNKAYINPALSDTAGPGQWTEGDPFTGVQSSNYWSGTTFADSAGYAWFVCFGTGFADRYIKGSNYYVWPVRGRQTASSGNRVILPS